MRPNRHPLRTVVEAKRRSGQGGLLSPHYFAIRWWDLVLECGHTVERTRSIDYPPGWGQVPRGMARMHHPPPDDPDYEKPPPKRARCEFCPIPEESS